MTLTIFDISANVFRISATCGYGDFFNKKFPSEEYTAERFPGVNCIMSHWVADYIGQPWVPGENDCWSFFRKIQANHFGRTVPIINVDALNRLSCVREFQSHTEYSMWYGIENPQDGDAVLLAKGKHPSHIGIGYPGKRFDS